MWNELLFYTLVWICIGFFLAFFLPSFMRFLTGKVQLKLSKKIYTYGDKLEWIFTVYAKKEIQWESLRVYLKAYQKQSWYGPKWEKSTRQVELFHMTQEIESWITYKPGTKTDYNIDLQIPWFDELFPESEASEGSKKSSKPSRYTILRSKRNTIAWEVRVKLEWQKKHLSSSRYIFVSE